MRTLTNLMCRILPVLVLVGLFAIPAPAIGAGRGGRATKAAASAPRGKVYLTVDEALKLAFPKLTVTRGTVYLTKEQVARAKKLAKVAIPSAVVHPYVAKDEKGKVVGVAWFDTHKVRSKKETVMFVVSPKRTIQRIEVLAFAEPPDYLPRGKWYAQFVGQALGPNLTLKRDIRNVTGATMTAEVTTEAARRVLALHEVVYPAKKPSPTPKPAPKK